MHANQILNYALRTSFAESPISCRISGCIRKSHYFNQPTVRVSLGLLSLCPSRSFIDRVLGVCINDAAVYLEENRDGANGIVVIEAVDAVVGECGILKSLISRPLCSVGPGSGVIGERRVFRDLSSHDACILRGLSSGFFSSRHPRLVFLGEFICLLEGLGSSQVLLIKPDPVGYQITVSISSSLSLQTQAAHDVSHGVALFAKP